jgi:hypothetical protein
MIGDDVRDDVLGAQKAGFKVENFINLPSLVQFGRSLLHY